MLLSFWTRFPTLALLSLALDSGPDFCNADSRSRFASHISLPKRVTAISRHSTPKSLKSQVSPPLVVLKLISARQYFCVFINPPLPLPPVHPFLSENSLLFLLLSSRIFHLLKSFYPTNQFLRQPTLSHLNHTIISCVSHSSLVSRTTLTPPICLSHHITPIFTPHPIPISSDFPHGIGPAFTMSTENPQNNNPEMMYTRNRRGSITQAALTNLFQRGNSVPNGSGFPQANGATHPIDTGRRRLSVTTLGLSGTSPNNAPPFNIRRGSMSTYSNGSDSIDEYAVEEDDAVYGNAKTAPTTPFVRRMSFGTSSMRPGRNGGHSPKNGNNPSPPPSVHGYPQGGKKASRPQAPTQGSSISAALSAAGRRASTTLVASSPPQASSTRTTRAPSDNYSPRPDQQGFNWSEQLRSRAESSVTGARPSFSLASGSPPRANSIHDRAKSVSEMPQPPVQAAAVKPRQERPKPDAFQERILKGDFYMD